MKGKYRAGLAAAVVLCAVCAAALPRPGENRVIAQARAAVESAAASEEDGCPVDFDAPRAENEDIYAWLYIPGTGINEPLVQREGDSYYYPAHDSAGKEDASGALFTESAYIVNAVENR